MSVVLPVKVTDIRRRVRSASSPAKHIVLAPAADSLPFLVTDTETKKQSINDEDGSIALFTSGVDRLNGAFKNALLVIKIL